ncbi:MAG: hypothetical protein O2785_01825 [Bacteroidetes bacterium]|nr:hypothetical protein [Bacteroidota bacterium]
MMILLEVIFKGLYSDYTWLKKEYISKYNQKKYSELSPKQIRGIINKYYNDLHDGNTKKLLFISVKKIQNILDKRLKTFENDTYNELNRFGDLNLYRYYQFVVAYKKALVKYYKEIILN